MTFESMQDISMSQCSNQKYRSLFISIYGSSNREKSTRLKASILKYIIFELKTRTQRFWLQYCVFHISLIWKDEFNCRRLESKFTKQISGSKGLAMDENDINRDYRSTFASKLKLSTISCLNLPSYDVKNQLAFNKVR